MKSCSYAAHPLLPSRDMTSFRLAVGAVMVVCAVAPVSASESETSSPRFAMTDVASPSAPPAGVPSPLKSPEDLKSPGKAPLLPPDGLPTAPPPDAIKPVEPQAEPAAPKRDPAAADGGTNDGSFRYLAVITGDCDSLVVADHTLPECAGKLLNVDFGNGRVAFLFSGREGENHVVTTFSGGVSQQSDARAYRLAIDRMSTTTVGAGGLPVTVVAAADGTCVMHGDPTHESTRFECRVHHAGTDTTATFRTVGHPEVYAGTPPGDAPASDEAEAQAFDRLAFRDRFPKTIDQ
jgi:hypothetical protein